MLSILVGSSSIDIDLDISLIVASLAPSILIVVTYYFSKKRNLQQHTDTTSSLNEVKEKVNGHLTNLSEKVQSIEEQVKVNGETDG